MVDCLQSLVFLVAPISLKIPLQKRYELIVACLFLFGVMGFMFIYTGSGPCTLLTKLCCPTRDRAKHNTDLVQ